jgi:hypothetical protein
LTNYLGVVGAAIISVGVIVGGLFFVSQTHPAELWRALSDLWGRWMERREAWQASRRTAQEQADALAGLLAAASQAQWRNVVADHTSLWRVVVRPVQMQVE